MNKTLYVKDDDGVVWDKARELAGDKLSSFIMEKLRAFVAEEEGAKRGYERIVLRLYEKGIPSAKAFFGRWIIAPSTPVEVTFGSEDEPPSKVSFAVAETQKGNYVVLDFEDIELSEDDFDGAFLDARFQVLDSLEQQSTVPLSVLVEAIKRLGVQVQELDI